MISSKKGNVASFLMENFGLILGAILVIALFFLASALYNTFVSHSQGTKESFRDLTSTIDEMMNNMSGEHAREQPYYIKHKFVLAGFSSGWGPTKYSPAARGESNLERPTDLCGSDACLCICEGMDENACIKNVVECKKIDKVNNFYATQSDAELCSFGLKQGSDYYLYFAGDQKTWYDRFLFFTNRQTCVFGLKILEIKQKGADIYLTIKD